MRFHVRSTDLPKAMSKRLKRRLPEMGYEIRKCAADQLLARMYGYRNWNDLLGNIGARRPDLYDQLVDPRTVAARRAHHIAVLVDWGCKPDDAAVLVDWGCKPDDAARLVEEIGPTSNRRLEGMRI